MFAARKGKAQLVGIVLDHPALSNVSVLRTIEIMRNEIDPALRDVPAC